MSSSLKSDKQIMVELGQAFEQMRLSSSIQDADVMKQGGLTKDALHKFKNGDNITILNFIRILRGVDKLDAIAKLFTMTDDQPLIAPKAKKETPKRIHKKKQPPPVKWGTS